MGNNLDGTTLVGWIVATVGFAGLYGAIRNESWLSVMANAVSPKNPTKPIHPTAG